MVEFFDAFVEAYEHGFTEVLLVLDEWEPVVEAAVFVVVVVEQVILITCLGSYCAPEGG